MVSYNIIYTFTVYIFTFLLFALHFRFPLVVWLII